MKRHIFTTIGTTIGAAIFAAGATMPAAAQRLIVSVSNHRVMVNSSFTGTELVLFGAIETTGRRGGNYDVVATVTGPRQTMVTYRKERILGIWVNAHSRTFVRVPSYLAVLSNRPIDRIADAETRRRLQLGLDNIPLPQGRNNYDPGADNPFRKAFTSINEERGLYRHVANGITFLTPTVFRAPISLPAEVPVGSYEIDVRLFADGKLIGATASAFELYKAGFEQFVTSAVRQHGFLYGIATASMALAIGWIASVVFRRD